MPKLLNFNPFLIVLFMFWISLSQAIPTVHEFENDVLAMLETRADYNRDHTTFEKHITWLIKNGDTKNTLTDRAYRRSMELIKTDRWQEAIWTLKRSGLVPYAESLENFLGLAMEHLDVERAHLTGEGVNRSVLATIKLSEYRSIEVLTKGGDGSSALATEAEIGAYHIDDFFKLNMVALTTSGKGRNEAERSSQLIVPEMRYSGLNFRDRGYQFAYPEVYFLDFLLGNLDRHHENSGYTRAKRFFVFDHGRLLAFASSLAPLEIHKQPFDPNYQLPYVVEQKIRQTTVEQLVAHLKTIGFPQTAIEYVAITYASVKKAIESRPTVAMPIAAMSASSVGPKQESPLMLYMGKRVNAQAQKKYEEKEAIRLKALAQEDALNQFLEEQDRQMEALFMESSDSMYLDKLNRSKNFKDLEYIVSLDRVLTTAQRQSQLIEKIRSFSKENKITDTELYILLSKFIKLRLSGDVRKTAESFLNELSAESTKNSCRRFYGN